ncbi:zf-HC2 domain-containing protein [Microbispora hainanensis]|uniref:anti-sigma factor family protein n=1 Tax=Microbispora hainanensis TaxID=568844 RepID=UPI002E27ACC5|nr:zf-HC2 domain-containing protein [Microbispora hainanensis]
MTCEEVRISLGSYVLGALDDAETAEVEAHLDTCAACRAELSELSGLPPLLARVSAEDIERAAAPPRAVLDGVFAGATTSAPQAAQPVPEAVSLALDAVDAVDAPPARRVRRSRVLLALAASVVVAAAGGTAWVSATLRGTETTTAAGSAAAAPAQADQAGQGEMAQDQSAQDQSAKDQRAQDQRVQADRSAEALVEPFAAKEPPTPMHSAASSSVPSAESSAGGVARKVQPPPAETPVAASPVPSEVRGSSGDVRIVVRLVPHDGGTQVVARVAGVPAGTVCTLRAVSKDGEVSTLGSWTVGRGELRGQNMVLEGSTALRPGQIDRIELTDSAGRVLVTVSL